MGVQEAMTADTLDHTASLSVGKKVAILMKGILGRHVSMLFAFFLTASMTVGAEEIRRGRIQLAYCAAE